jgi:hypothetical protein
MKMVVFWNAAPCSVVEVDRRVITLMMQAVTSLKCRSTTTRLHSATSQKTTVFNPLGILIVNSLEQHCCCIKGD